MSLPVRYVLGRVAWAVVAVYLVLSGLFALVAFTPDPNAALVEYAAALPDGPDSSAVDAYRSARNLDDPLVSRYLRFLVALTTLDWGTSYEFGRPVTALLADRAPPTLAYVLPAVAGSAAGGTVVGTVLAGRDSPLLDGVVSGTAYVGYGLPDFWLAPLTTALLVGYVGVTPAYDPATSALAPGNLLVVGPAAAVLGVTLFAAQLRYVRAGAREQLRAAYVKTARAKGAGPVRVARHVLRNAVVPVVSLYFADLLGVLFVSSFVVEVAFGIPGLADLGYTAIRNRDVPVVMAVALLPVVASVLGTTLQDLAYLALDPRAGE